MKQFKLMMMAALAALMSFSVVSCSDDDDDSAQSKHDKKMEAVSAEVKANKKHDIALLLVTFGSTWDAPQETFKGMKEQFAKKFSNMDVYFSFTSEICMLVADLNDVDEHGVQIDHFLYLSKHI